MEEKNIVLNFMYSGKYLLEGNLGHEVINMFKDDNGDNYIYLQPHGTFAKDKKGKFETILMVQYIKPGCVEILAKAIGAEGKEAEENKVLEEVDSALASSIKYGGKSLQNIFKGNYAQQDVCITFKAARVIKPKEPLYIYFEKETDTKGSAPYTEKGALLKGCGVGNQSMKQYFSNIKDLNNYNALKSIIDNNGLWEKEVDKLNMQTPLAAHTMFDVCGIKYDELAHSHALYYFLQNYDFAAQFVKNVLKVPHPLTRNYRVYRERHNIDIYLTDDNFVVIIENKIKSDINGVNKNGSYKNQLSKYIEKARLDIANFRTCILPEPLKKELVAIKELKEKKAKDKKNTDITIADLSPKQIAEIDKMIYAYVLFPNYNKIDLGKYDKKGKYKPISYQELRDALIKFPGYKNPSHFKEFVDSLLRHTKAKDEELYTTMQDLFIKRIKNA